MRGNREGSEWERKKNGNEVRGKERELKRSERKNEERQVRGNLEKRGK